MPRRRKRSKSRGVIRRRRRRFDSEDDRISLDSPACLIPKSLKEVSAVSYYDNEGTTLSEIARTHSHSHTQTQTKKDTTDANSTSTENNTVGKRNHRS